MSGRHRIYLAAAVTLFGMGGLGLLLMIVFHEQTFSNFFPGEKQPVLLQLLYGALYGIMAVLLLLRLLRLRFLKHTGQFFRKLLLRYRVGWLEIIMISVSAGVGEELLFRGGIQPWLGIWPTALIFVALHGYLNPRDHAVFIYGVVMIPIAAGLGWLYKESGIWAAALAHTIIDVVLMARILTRNQDPYATGKQADPVG